MTYYATAIVMWIQTTGSRLSYNGRTGKLDSSIGLNNDSENDRNDRLGAYWTVAMS